ncbi:MAG: LysR family transcriptional regulator [Polyangiales bacterium]
MDWRAARFDWNRARAFLAVAEERSFSAAARVLAMSQPTVGRQVAALERELGVALFERVGHTLALTAAGADLVEQVRAMREAATRVSRIAAGQSLALDGTVCITASELIAAYVLPPALARIRREHPGIEIEVVASNAVRDLRRREADIAVRNVKPTQPDLLARRFDDRAARAYATPACLARIGDLRRPDDVARAELFAFDRSDRIISYLAPLGVKLTPQNFPIVTENHLVQWALCREGIGIAFVMEEVGDRDPGVVRVPGLPTLPVPIWLVAHRELATSRRIRVVFDLLAEELARGPTRGRRTARARPARGR